MPGALWKTMQREMRFLIFLILLVYIGYYLVLEINYYQTILRRGSKLVGRGEDRRWGCWIDGG